MVRICKNTKRFRTKMGNKEKISFFTFNNSRSIRKWTLNLTKIGLFENNVYLCIDKSRSLPIRTAYPARHFLYIDMRYTKYAMTLAQQILILQNRG